MNRPSSDSDAEKDPAEQDRDDDLAETVDKKPDDVIHCDGFDSSDEKRLADQTRETVDHAAKPQTVEGGVSEAQTILPGSTDKTVTRGGQEPQATDGGLTEAATVMPGSTDKTVTRGGQGPQATDGGLTEAATVMPGSTDKTVTRGGQGPQATDGGLTEAATVMPGSTDKTVTKSDGSAMASEQATILTGAGAPSVEKVETIWGNTAHGDDERMTIKKEAGTVTRTSSVSQILVKPRFLQSKAEEPSLKDLPDYQLIDVLGEGGMGVVYRAHQTSVDRPVAIKMIKPHVATQPEARARFLAEAGVTGDLDHPNIVPIHDLGSDASGALFYAMKQVKGKPWDDRIKEMSLEENLEVLLRVCDALAFAHSRGVIHRDLKPENVMLGDFGEVLVMDWGLAAAVRDGAKTDRIDQTTALGGSPAYMAPEMAEGAADRIGVHSDIYLLGAILFEIATGKPPHTGGGVMECLVNAAQNIIQPVEADDELVAVARKAMATDPTDRYPSAKEFQKSVRDCQSHLQSIELAKYARDTFTNARNTGDYEKFADARAAYRDALKLWDGNRQAREGEAEVRRAYAETALKRGDLDLALSLLPAEDTALEPLRERVLEAKAEAEKRRARQKQLYAAVGILLAVIFAGLVVGVVWINNERAKTEKQRRIAVEQKQIAEEQRLLAEEQKQEAIRQKQRAEEQEKIAKASEAEAIAQKQIADEQKREAIKQKQRAEEQRKLAEAARKEAEKANRQAQIAKLKAEENEQLAHAAMQKTLELQARMMKTQAPSVSSTDVKQALAQLKKRLAEQEELLDADWALDAKQAQKLQADAAAAIEQPVELEVELPGGDKMAFRLVPAGSFVMGSPPTEQGRAEMEIPRPVTLSRHFYLGKHEVTQAQWVAITEAGNPSYFKEGDDAGKRPVEQITWDLIREAFLPRMQKLAPAGFRFRLPTEAEWEYACRGGTATRFYIGTTETKLKSAAWYMQNSDGAPHSVGLKTPNAWGLYDMHGNVAEWCADSFDPEYYLAAPEENPFNDENTPRRVIRGGAWVNLPQHCRSAYRSWCHVNQKHNFLGFRLALVPVDEGAEAPPVLSGR